MNTKDELRTCGTCGSNGGLCEDARWDVDEEAGQASRSCELGTHFGRKKITLDHVECETHALKRVLKETKNLRRIVKQYLTECCVCGAALELPTELAHCEGCVGDTTDYEKGKHE